MGRGCSPVHLCVDFISLFSYWNILNDVLLGSVHFLVSYWKPQTSSPFPYLCEWHYHPLRHTRLENFLSFLIYSFPSFFTLSKYFVCKFWKCHLYPSCTLCPYCGNPGARNTYSHLSIHPFICLSVSWRFHKPPVFKKDLKELVKWNNVKLDS